MVSLLKDLLTPNDSFNVIRVRDDDAHHLVAYVGHAVVGHGTEVSKRFVVSGVHRIIGRRGGRVGMRWL